ncbi:MAG: three-Cys-motif partner protein TcmP [Rhodospirillaceae bacterium]|nr:three-Cys-motif partner protein TcmP [Rhodospirillaceae bacterium]
MEQRFGGRWTEEKLSRVKAYLAAYTTALRKQPFERLYIDAFAGTGYRTAQRPFPPMFPDLQDVAKGSARMALEVQPPFDRYVFIEHNRRRFSELAKLAQLYPGLKDRITLLNEDANVAVKRLCQNIDWRRCRAVLFLDPFGMQVDWDTIEAVARSKAIDLWYLVPVGIGIARVTPRNADIPRGWARRLDRMLGDCGWRDAWYAAPPTGDLFGPRPHARVRTADIPAMEAFVLERLKSVFAGVAPHGLRLGPGGGAHYLLVFAVGNPRAKDLALRIARHILGSGLA